MFSHFIGKFCKAILDFIVRTVSALNIHPNYLTLIGFLFTGLAAFHLAKGKFFSAGILIIVAGIFDMLDGRVARITNNVTRFGAFFDSVLDRYSDIAIYLGLVIYYSKGQRISYVMLSGVAMVGSVMTSYTRARAESLIPSCKVGFMERPERLVLLIIGMLANRMGPVLWVIAFFSNMTVVHRIIYTWKETSRLEQPLTSEEVKSKRLTGTASLR
ncbi:MAG TPA: CDP-alcohol phosphatidyltransferase family protein [Candidatus Hodarchaeales archaeon]|nr:CDP-alcohol phosphatidyltransferase family protein [Candidatus Hodarchaeales archaeon]